MSLFNRIRNLGQNQQEAAAEPSSVVKLEYTHGNSVDIPANELEDGMSIRDLARAYADDLGLDINRVTTVRSKAGIVSMSDLAVAGESYRFYVTSNEKG